MTIIYHQKLSYCKCLLTNDEAIQESLKSRTEINGSILLRDHSLVLCSDVRYFEIVINYHN